MFPGCLKSGILNFNNKLRVNFYRRMYFCYVLQKYYNKNSSLSCILETRSMSKMPLVCDWREYMVLSWDFRNCEGKCGFILFAKILCHTEWSYVSRCSYRLQVTDCIVFHDGSWNLNFSVFWLSCRAWSINHIVKCTLEIYGYLIFATIKFRIDHWSLRVFLVRGNRCLGHAQWLYYLCFNWNLRCLGLAQY